MSKKDWIVEKWIYKDNFENMVPDPVTIEKMNSPLYPVEKFAVRRLGFVLAKDEQWEWEPQPSSRDDEFYKRCRFDSFDEASKAAEKAIKEKE
jgi:hypothetical protein